MQSKEWRFSPNSNGRVEPEHSLCILSVGPTGLTPLKIILPLIAQSYTFIPSHPLSIGLLPSGNQASDPRISGFAFERSEDHPKIDQSLTLVLAKSKTSKAHKVLMSNMKHRYILYYQNGWSLVEMVRWGAFG